MPLLLGFGAGRAVHLARGEHRHLHRRLDVSAANGSPGRWFRLGKLGAWFLLMIISYVLVALVNRPRSAPLPAADPGLRVNRTPAGLLASP